MLLTEIKAKSIEARKAKDSVAANLLGMVLTDIQNRAREARRDPSEEDCEAALKRAKKMNDQAAAIAPTEQLVAERAVLDSFMLRAFSAITEEELNEIISKLVAENPDKVNPKGAGWFMGQVMKATSGHANPATVRPLIDKALGA